MKNEKNLLVTAETQKNRASNERVEEVLYQRIGDRWYAFSEINGEVFFGSIDPDQMNELKKDPTAA
jgi:hypothetical protein